MKIIIAGAGEVGTHLAKMLSGEKQDIILMDTDEEKLGQLEDNFDLMTVNASSLSIAGLKEANVPNADLFIGVTPDESRNMTSCLLAHSLGAKKTVARIDNAEYLQPKHQEFFANIGINSLIYPEMLAAREIVDAIKMILERTPPELGVDIIRNGIFLTGGVANLKGLDGLIADATNIKVNLVDKPEECVARGLERVIKEKQFRSLTFVTKEQDYK